MITTKTQISRWIFQTLALAMIVGSLGAKADDTILDGHEVGLHPFGCRVEASGTMLYMRGQVLSTYGAKLVVDGDKSTLTVAGVSNQVAKVRVSTCDRTGRTTMTLLFENPPVLGGKTSVLLTGTTIQDATKIYYYGDIYESDDDHETVCGRSNWFETREARWVHKGGFQFTRLK